MLNFIIFLAFVDIGMAIVLYFGDKGGDHEYKR